MALPAFCDETDVKCKMTLSMYCLETMNCSDVFFNKDICTNTRVHVASFADIWHDQH